MRTQLRRRASPASPDFWGGTASPQGPFSTAATKRSPWVAQVTTGSTAAKGPSVASSARVRGVRVHEVEPLLRDALEEHTSLGRLDRRPPHVRHDGCDEPVDGTGPLPHAEHGCRARLARPLEHHLHADTHAEHRAATRQPQVDDPRSVRGREPGHARVEVADAGHEQAVGRQRGPRSAVSVTSAPTCSRARTALWMLPLP